MTQVGTQVLTAEEVRVGVVVAFDLGRPRRDVSLAASLPARAFKVGRNPKYFDEGLFRPLWQLEPAVAGRVDSYSNSTTWPASPDSIDLHNAEAEISTFLHDFGFGAVFIVLTVPGPASTDDMLWAANCVSDTSLELTFADGRTWRLSEAIDAARAATSAVFAEVRTSVWRPYSMIHIIKLQSALLDHLKVGETIYEHFEREFHALSVRVLHNWRERFPKGSHISEENASVAPSGVLRFNARNVLIYEHPYSAEEIESLLYPALIEMRLWEFMASVELVELRALTSSLDDRTDRLRTAGDLARSRHSSLRIASEFEALSACTSKRTRRFYRAGIQEFGLDETLAVLRDRASQIEGVLSRLVLGDEVRRDAEFASQQRDLALRAQETARRTEGTTTVLRALGLLVALQIVLQVSGDLGLRAGYRLLIGAVSVTVVVSCALLVQRLSDRRGRVRLSEEDWLSTSIPVSAVFAGLFRLAATRKITEIQSYQAGDIVVMFPFARDGWKGAARVHLSEDGEGRIFARSELLLTSVRRVPSFPPSPSAVELLRSLGITGLRPISAEPD